MKLIIKKLFGIILIIVCVVLTSCEKDDNSSPDNHIKYGGKEYDLSDGFLLCYGNNNSHTSYNIVLSLFSSGITIYESEETVDSATGTGNIIMFDIYTTSEFEINNGNYYYSEDLWTKGSFSDISEYAINYNFSDESDSESIDIKNGQVLVTKNGNEYEISFDCVDENYEIVSGYYKGDLKIYKGYFCD